MYLLQILLAVLAGVSTHVAASDVELPPLRKVCTVEPAPNGGDSAGAIISAFKECGKGGTVAFRNETYHVNSVMNTTGLEDCTIELRGTLLVSHLSMS
jgi:galacturan 1,4-alpha-galacturonidase